MEKKIGKFICSLQYGGDIPLIVVNVAVRPARTKATRRPSAASTPARTRNMSLPSEHLLRTSVSRYP